MLRYTLAERAYLSYSFHVHGLLAARAFFICTGVALWLATGVRAQGETLPTLRGQEAIERLKQSGNYDSLMEAVKNAGGDNSRTGGETTRSVVGESATLLAEDGAADDFFGNSVAISGDTAIVGSYQNLFANLGAAYIFVRSGTTWTQQQKLMASDGGADDFFGNSVAISGNTAIVGAYQDDGSFSNQGSVYVYIRSGTIWSLQQKLTASDAGISERFGNSVSISVNTAVIGAYVGDNPFSDQGAAYVFVRSGTIWTQQEQKLTAIYGDEFDNFGGSVAISGNNMIVGAYRDDVGANTDQGSAFIYRDPWLQEARSFAPDGATDDNFGWSVAISGDTAVVGAGYDDVSFTNQGSAYVFVRSGTSWTLQQKLTASDGGAGDGFGTGVAISGDTIIAGAYVDNVSFNHQGSAYIFVRSGTTWSQQQKLVASDGTANDYFGWSVAISGDTAVVGTWVDDISPDQSSAYVFVRSGTSWTQQQKLIASDGVLGDGFGWSVAISSDTIIVGAYLGDDSFINQGAAYVFVRSGTTWTQQQKLIASDGATNDRFGNSVAISGNTVIVGAYWDDVNLTDTDQGSVYIFVRSGTNWSVQQKFSNPYPAGGDQFGWSVAISGDTIVVGANLDHIIYGHDGAAYVFVRSGVTWTRQQTLVGSDIVAGGVGFGNGVAISSDKIIVGAPYYSVSTLSPLTGDNNPLAPQAANQGVAYIFAKSSLPTTSAGVAVSGRVLAGEGVGVGKAIVSLTGSSGNIRTAITNPFGYYRFEDVEVGQITIINVRHKQFAFAPQVLNITEDVGDLNFMASP